MNILLTCAGRRNYLVSFFQEALGGRGQVFAADADSDAPALYSADKAFIVPSLNDNNYVDTLLGLCQEHQVRLLVPLHDLELPLLAKQTHRFHELDTLPVVSSPQVVDTCFDKWATLRFLQASGLAIPETYLSLTAAREGLSRGDLTFPVVVKPRWGTASIGIDYAEDDEELEWTYNLLKRRLARTLLKDVNETDPAGSVLIQKRLQGPEYGLDVVNDLEGRYVCTFIRRKLQMRAGETDRAITVKNDSLEEIGAITGRKLGHLGNLDCDVVVTDERSYVLDMNPRFGGGYPFSHIAGANLPAALIRWAERGKPDAEWLRAEPNVIAAKCDRLVVLKNKCSKTWLGTAG